MAMAELDPAVETMTSIWILACEASDKTIRAPTTHPSYCISQGALRSSLTLTSFL